MIADVLLVATTVLIVGLIGYLIVRFASVERTIVETMTRLPIAVALTSKHGFMPLFRRFGDALVKMDAQSDPLLQDLARFRLNALVAEVENLARGTVVFTGTETWRAAYRDLLLTLRVQSYFSVAWVRSSDYWSDLPGQHSVQMNYDLVKRGFHIERVHVLADSLWPFEERYPALAIRSWLQEQHDRGIRVHVLREVDLAGEPDLLQDFAVYGDRAAAIQELDDQSRTIRFVLSFDPDEIRQALDRWQRLSLYAISWEKLLDLQERS